MNDKTISINSNLEIYTAEAGISLNPAYQWAKILVCDTEPNGNKMRIPEEEFDNLISTGINAPIKMARKQIAGHREALGNPIGVISQLTKEGNKLYALAALWETERPDDVAKLKDMFLAGNPPNVSWEILYKSAEIEEDVQVLRGCILNGLAVVAMPAYKGRTPFVAMSEIEAEEITDVLGEADVWTRAYIDSLPDTSFLYIEDGDNKGEAGLRYFPYRDYTNATSIPHLKNALATIDNYDLDEVIKEKIKVDAQKLLLEANSNLEDNTKNMEELEQVKTELTELKEKYSAKEAELSELSTKYTNLEVELTGLKEFKAEIDAEKEKTEKLGSIKSKFKEAGIEKEDTYFSEKSEILLKLDEAGLDFMIQELLSFKTNSASASLNTQVPNIVGKTGVTKDEILSELKARHQKKQ